MASERRYSVKNGRRRGRGGARPKMSVVLPREGQGTESDGQQALTTGFAERRDGRTSRASSGLVDDRHIEEGRVARVVDDAESSGDEREHFLLGAW